MKLPKLIPWDEFTANFSARSPINSMPQPGGLFVAARAINSVVGTPENEAALRRELSQSGLK